MNSKVQIQKTSLNTYSTCQKTHTKHILNTSYKHIETYSKHKRLSAQWRTFSPQPLSHTLHSVTQSGWVAEWLRQPLWQGGWVAEWLRQPLWHGGSVAEWLRQSHQPMKWIKFLNISISKQDYIYNYIIFGIDGNLMYKHNPVNFNCHSYITSTDWLRTATYSTHFEAWPDIT